MNKKAYRNLMITVLILAVAVVLAACGAREIIKQAESATLQNEGLKLTVPAEYASLVTVENPEKAEDGMLFSISENESLEAAKANGEPSDSGAGWLFGIRRVSEAELQELLRWDMSGEEPIAVDENGDYYLFCHPTDVRLVRRSNEEMTEGLEQWSKLNEWAAAVRESFVKENAGLQAPDVNVLYSSDDMLGRWAEKYAGRGVIEITRGAEDSTYDVRIHWGSSAFESANWEMTAVPEGFGVLRYENCRCYVRTYTSEEEYTDSVEYENGTGSFYLNSANEIQWVDDIAHMGDDTVFVYAD